MQIGFQIRKGKFFEGSRVLLKQIPCTRVAYYKPDIDFNPVDLTSGAGLISSLEN